MSTKPAPAIVHALEAASASYRVVRHADLPGPIHSAEDVARMVGVALEQVAKTLLVSGTSPSGQYALAVLAVNSRLNFGAVGDLQGWSRATMASPEQLARQLGQPIHGVSPIGAQGLPVIIDEALFGRSPILVGAGVVGVEIEIDPFVLVALTGGTSAPISESRASPRHS